MTQADRAPTEAVPVTQCRQSETVDTLPAQAAAVEKPVAEAAGAEPVAADRAEPVSEQPMQPAAAETLPEILTTEDVAAPTRSTRSRLLLPERTEAASRNARSGRGRDHRNAGRRTGAAAETSHQARAPCCRETDAEKSCRREARCETREEAASQAGRKARTGKAKAAAGSGGQSAADARRGATDGSAAGKTARQGQKRHERDRRGNAAVSNYPGKVMAKLRRAARGIPRGARLRAQRDVQVGFVVNASGGVGGVRIVQSSGSPDLDRAALDTVRRAAPFPPIPGDAGRSSWRFTLPLGLAR